jgi:SH3 domain
MKAKAKFDFNAQAGNQINLKRGQVYSLLHNGGPGGWSKGVDPVTGTIIIMFA